MPDNIFRTSDTPLAAFLYSKNIRLIGVERENSKVFFCFADTTLLQRLAQSFQLTSAYGNITAYNNAYKYLVTLIKQG
jgi:hypothetical protein